MKKAGIVKIVVQATPNLRFHSNC